MHEKRHISRICAVTITVEPRVLIEIVFFMDDREDA
jgi:hypothetical protein